MIASVLFSLLGLVFGSQSNAVLSEIHFCNAESMFIEGFGPYTNYLRISNDLGFSSSFRVENYLKRYVVRLIPMEMDIPDGLESKVRDWVSFVEQSDVGDLQLGNFVDSMCAELKGYYGGFVGIVQNTRSTSVNFHKSVNNRRIGTLSNGSASEGLMRDWEDDFSNFLSD